MSRKCSTALCLLREGWTGSQPLCPSQPVLPAPGLNPPLALLSPAGCLGMGQCEGCSSPAPPVWMDGFTSSGGISVSATAVAEDMEICHRFFQHSCWWLCEQTHCCKTWAVCSFPFVGVTSVGQSWIFGRQQISCASIHLWEHSCTVMCPRMMDSNRKAGQPTCVLDCKTWDSQDCNMQRGMK